MKFWLARNQYGSIYLFTIEPKYNAATDEWNGYDFEQIELGFLCFPEVTFENSPHEVELKLVK